MLDASRLNYGVVTLIPKVAGAMDIRQFRPITVINVMFRILAKAHAIRAAPIVARITHLNQTAFIQGRRIHDGVLALHEIIHEVKITRHKAVFFKIDFHKAYDTISWDFLREALQRKGFDDRWITRIMQLVGCGSTTININGETDPYFKPSRGGEAGGPDLPFSV